MHHRRDFLRYLGIAVGATLTGCGGDSGSGGFGGGFGGSGGAAPSGYRFVPLANAGGVLPKSTILAKGTEQASPFIGGVMINDRRHVCFQANDASERKGVFEIDYDAQGSTSPVKHLIQEGDVLPDGTVVKDVSGGYLNNADELVFVVTDPTGHCTMQVSHQLGPFETKFKDYQTVSPNCILDGDMQPEVGLADNGDLLFVCCGKDEEGTAIGEALYYCPRDVTGDTVKLIGENELLPGTNCCIRTMGCCEMGKNGNYLVQGSAATTESGNSVDGDTTSGLTYLAAGRVGESPEVLVADPALGISGAIQGSINMGARLGDGACGFVCQTNSDKTQLYLNKTKLLDASTDGSGSLTPRGQRIISMLPPVFGPNGLILVEVFTKVGCEILAYNGSTFSSVLGTGDIVNGKTIAMILFGCLPHAINSFGEFVVVVEYSDGDSAILLGMPA